MGQLDHVFPSPEKKIRRRKKTLTRGNQPKLAADFNRPELPHPRGLVDAAGDHQGLPDAHVHAQDGPWRAIPAVFHVFRVMERCTELLFSLFGRGEEAGCMFGVSVLRKTKGNTETRKSNPFWSARCCLCVRLTGSLYFSPTAESFGVSAQIGSGVVRGSPEVRFHKGSTRVPPGFHQGSTRVPPGFHEGSTRFCEGSTRFCEGGKRAPHAVGDIT